MTLSGVDVPAVRPTQSTPSNHWLRARSVGYLVSQAASLAGHLGELAAVIAFRATNNHDYAAAARRAIACGGPLLADKPCR